ncbi:hypothetical protein SASPL_155138 [Salvia splendens]|uniref:Pectinesterase inhibitor domain-containing protein n=2 Tax=Salvia splendens TaxID=180675 RepID=A0A8X8YZC9_SALSN|nr:hypothetical protein SASPL_155138 [Salvia splendens]
MPIAVLFLSLCFAAAAESIAESPFPASVDSIAEPPFAAFDSPAPAPAYDEMLMTADNLEGYEDIPEPILDPFFPVTAESIAEPPFPASDSPAPAPAYDETAEAPASNNIIDKGAMDSHYLTAHLSAAANKVEQFVATEVDGKLKDPATVASARDCLELCKEVYESAADSMKKAVKSISTGDFIKANFDVSAFSTDIDTCNSECSIAGFETFEKWAQDVASDCLDRILQHSNRV